MLTDLAEALALRGHDVHVVCSRGRYDGQTTPRPAEEIHSAVHIHRVAATGLGRRRMLHRLCDYATFYTSALARCLALPPADVCIALTTPPFVSGIGAIYKKLRGASLVIWAMDLYPEMLAAMGIMRRTSLEYRLLQRAARTIYRQADRVISLAPEMTDRLVGCGVDARRIQTVPSWSPGETVSPTPSNQTPFRDRHDINGHFVVMYSGNMGVVHEFPTILSAARRLAHRKDVLFLFVGEGAQKPQLMETVRQSRLENVRFFPYEPLDRLSESLGAADMHLISMKRNVEGLLVPCKLYGILAAGRPSCLVGPRDNEVARRLLESESGWVVPPGESAELANHIEALITRRDLVRTMGTRARTHYEQQCSRTRRTGELITTLESLTTS